ncbi:MAG TPA: aminopeptidase P family N-terminal domain-containing protein, partial [Spirochaetales bacterium]|nr:aminopeptidase P family N-terminal domain-containing protein [Spirochaetales bacterium]
MDKYAERRAKVAAWLANKGIAAAMFEDTEGRRDPSIRYLSGQPGDSLLFVTAKGRSVLVPWDANMAARYASADRVVPYGEYGRQAAKALAALAEDEGIPHGALVELPAATPYPVYVDYAAEVENLDFTCRADGVDEFVLGLRAVKDDAEVALYRRAAAITDEVADEIERMVREGRAKTEADVALFIERACRERGCEGTGFDTLAAGPGRSFGIHAFPN